MITVATCFDIIEANRYKMALESAGIPAFIPDAMTASLAPHFFTSSGIRLQVLDEHATQAQQIIEEERQAS
jgi:hypothetical protein